MSEADNIAPFLAQFPGPVTVRASRRTGLALLAGWLMLVSWAAVSKPSREDLALLITTITFLVPLIAIALLLPNMTYLKLDATGFFVKRLIGVSHFAWSDVSDFAAVMLLGKTMVCFSCRKDSGQNGIWKALSPDGRRALYEAYGLSSYDLACLLAAWQARALKR